MSSPEAPQTVPDFVLQATPRTVPPEGWPEGQPLSWIDLEATEDAVRILRELATATAEADRNSEWWKYEEYCMPVDNEFTVLLRNSPLRAREILAGLVCSENVEGRVMAFFSISDAIEQDPPLGFALLDRLVRDPDEVMREEALDYIPYPKMLAVRFCRRKSPDGSDRFYLRNGRSAQSRVRGRRSRHQCLRSVLAIPGATAARCAS